KFATGKKLHAHNVYGQVAGETGTVGVLALTCLVIAYIVNVRAIRRAVREQAYGDTDFLAQLAGAIGLGLFLLLFGGIFGHNLLRTQWIFYAALLIIARQCVESRAALSWYAQPDEAEAPAFDSSLQPVVGLP